MSANGDSSTALPHQQYISLLPLAATIGIPVSILSWGFLQLLHEAQHFVWHTVPHELDRDTAPWWWVVLMLLLAAVVTGFAITKLPGAGGHVPVHGASATGVEPNMVPGILLAGFASLAFGAVLGPEAPLIALGSGLGILGVRLVDKQPVAAVAAVAGCFAALSTVFGSPLIAAFMMMELIGLGRPLASRVLLPGLLAAGVGSLVFFGLGEWTGLQALQMSGVSIEAFHSTDVPDILWAIAIGVAASGLYFLIKSIGLTVETWTRVRPFPAVIAAGLLVAGSAIAFELLTPHSVAEVLLSGQDRMNPLLENAGTWTSGALILLILFKGLAYGLSLGSFRGGSIFPAMFLGLAAGLLIADLPGLGQTPAIAAAVGGMTAAAFGFPLSSVLLAAFFLNSAGPELIAIVIIAVAASHVVTEWMPAAKPFTPLMPPNLPESTSPHAH